MKFLVIITFLVKWVSALQDYEEWDVFMAQHSKSYTGEEEQNRFKIFQDNLSKIKEHNTRYNNGEVSYFLKVTKFADLTDDEFKAGLSFPKGERPIMHSSEKASSNFTSDIPDAIDWRDRGVVSDVKDQGNCSASFAFAVTGCIESQFTILKYQKILFSEQELIDCSWNSYGCMGNWMQNAYMYVTNMGLSSEDQYPYVANDDGLCNKNITYKPLTGLKSNTVIFDKSEVGLAQGVANIGPISTEIDATNWKLYGGGIYDDPNCYNSVNHNVLVIGYQPDHWIIKNSWGKSWGENGYMRLARGKNLCHVAGNMPYPVLW